MDERAPVQSSGDIERPDTELHGNLIETRDMLDGFDDSSLMRDKGVDREQLRGGRLVLDGGADGLYPHLVMLDVDSGHDGEKLDEFFSINTFPDGSLQVVAVRRSEGKAPDSYLVIAGKDGSLEGYPTDERDMHKKKVASKDLSADEASAIVEGVTSRFNEERQRRIGILRGNR